jgi:hypothetical protein
MNWPDSGHPGARNGPDRPQPKDANTKKVRDVQTARTFVFKRI